MHCEKSENPEKTIPKESTTTKECTTSKECTAKIEKVEEKPSKPQESEEEAKGQKKIMMGKRKGSDSEVQGEKNEKKEIPKEMPILKKETVEK